MNLVSFVDELVKVGAMRCLHKRAADMGTSDIPAGMMSPAPAPPASRVVPDEASTRIGTANLPSVIRPGSMGPVAGTRRPIDRERFNRPYVERR